MSDESTYEINKVMEWCKENLQGRWTYYIITHSGKDLRFSYHIETIMHFENLSAARYYISFENEADYCLFYLTWG